jgi:ABC-type transport system involved in cytochrome c biogenesis permease subunit
MVAQSVAFWSAVTAYALASVLFFAWLAFRREWAQFAGLAVAAIGLIPHAVSLGLRWREVGHGPFSTRYEVLSADSFLVVSVFVILALANRRLRPMGVVVLPATFLLMGWAVSSFGLKYEVPIIFKSYWLWLHIGFAKLFFVFALLTAAAGLAYLLGDRFDAIQARLPAAERLDLFGHQFLLVSFLCLGVMIVAGSLWAHQSWGRYWGWDPIETSSLAVWLGYAVILHFRVLHNWSGRRMAWLNLVAFALAIFTVFVVVMVLPTIHNFYMVGP